MPVSAVEETRACQKLKEPLALVRPQAVACLPSRMVHKHDSCSASANMPKVPLYQSTAQQTASRVHFKLLREARRAAAEE